MNDNAGNPSIIFADGRQIETFVDAFLRKGYIVDMSVDWLGGPLDLTVEITGWHRDDLGFMVLEVCHVDEDGVPIPGEHADVEWAHIYEIEFH